MHNTLHGDCNVEDFGHMGLSDDANVLRHEMHGESEKMVRCMERAEKVGPFIVLNRSEWSSSPACETCRSILNYLPSSQARPITIHIAGLYPGKRFFIPFRN